MTRRLLQVLLLLGVLLTAAGGMAAAQDAAAPGAALPSGIATPSDAAVGAPPSGLGQVVFFRTAAVVGMPYTFHLREGTAAYGEVSNGHYVVVNLAPGSHTFTGPEAAGDLRLEIRDGETRYVRVTMSMGLVLHRASLTPSTAEVFQQAVSGLGRNPPHP